jgi:uncharacterized protein with gpF-like domain
VIKTNDDDDGDDGGDGGNRLDSDNRKEGDDKAGETKDEVVEDLLKKYEKMKEEIQRERMVSHTVFLST